MTGDQIRKRFQFRERPVFGELTGDAVDVLAEIAAQLAELNEKLLDLNISVADPTVSSDRR